MKIGYRIRNFKAFADSGNIEFSPITVLCGVNSAGKSSIIKSILLAKQSAAVRRSALSSSLSAQPLILNGEFTHLGAWSDTITSREKDRQMFFSWSIEASDRDYSETLRRLDLRASRRNRKVAGRNDRKEQKVKLSVAISSDPSVTEELSMRVDEWHLELNGCKIKVMRSLHQSDNENETYSIEVDSLKKLLAREAAQLGRYGLYLGDTLKAIASADDRISLGNVAVTLSGPFVGSVRPILDNSWAPFFDSLYEIAEHHRGVKRGPVPKWINQLQNAARTYKRQVEDDKDDHARSPVTRSLIFLAIELVEEISRCFAEVKTMLSPMWRDIRYIGPLRDQPRRYYQFDDTGGADVGVSGEFTVQVLALEQHRRIVASRIEESSEKGIEFSNPIEGSLLEHTNHWLSMMGLPFVSPSGLEQSLYKLEVGDLGVGLLDVGFGVSQVLPIVVEALRAQQGDLVILEQPEIHLHPMVQAKLGDFLIARSRDGVRFLVESHSEYFIKRLCRRFAESDLIDMDDLANILFVEGAPGDAHCRKVIISEYGEVENWPSGFFDLDEDLYWAKAALNKRKRARGATKQQ